MESVIERAPSSRLVSYWSTEVLLHVHYDKCWAKGSCVTHDCSDSRFDTDMCTQLKIVQFYLRKMTNASYELLFLGIELLSGERLALTVSGLSSVQSQHC